MTFLGGIGLAAVAGLVLGFAMFVVLFLIGISYFMEGT